jgi:hypothetical protein
MDTPSGFLALPQIAQLRRSESLSDPLEVTEAAPELVKLLGDAEQNNL